MHHKCSSREGIRSMINNAQTSMAVSQITASDAASNSSTTRPGLPKDFFVKCPRCREMLYRREWERNLKVCRGCGYHFRLSAAERIASLLDTGSFVEADAGMKSDNPLKFADQSRPYTEKLLEEQ